MIGILSTFSRVGNSETVMARPWFSFIVLEVPLLASPGPASKPQTGESPVPAKNIEAVVAEKDEEIERVMRDVEAGKIALAAERAKTRTLVQKKVDELSKKHMSEIAELEGRIRELENTIKGERESLKKAVKITDENNTLRVRIRDYESKLESAKNKIARLETQLKVKEEDILTSARLVKNLTEQRDLFKAQLEGLGQAASDTELLAANARYEALVSAHKQALECEQKARGEAVDLRVKNEAHARERARLYDEVNALKKKIIKDQQDHLAERDRMSATFNQRIEEITREFADGVATKAEERRRSGGGATSEKLRLRVEELTFERDALLGELEECRKEVPAAVRGDEG
ncbi:coiled-coil domain-containing protein, putative [Perkinsus marinus ATCC 50983]|uniref:Coiled-coil domain-containing protein, putative n=2 Tax=Perkinsus marinus (strain ATCC 50983 / TXsc) TaxID=423536 RepID=C5KSW3_PERM5|nr:coiled-coil domain-containing protein, putative [Perkinsus marinus ATCC 50983]EER12313.1 coiled-coil domain-containing protein, putative [Perkinsus marinus ATCC 50983]|eukprot:XP_002780518.1 coiled-coil domain-containing protein, putative [Perkinsus marinus ATCC 50983]